MILALTAVALSAYAIGRAQRLKQQPAQTTSREIVSARELRGEQKAAVLLMALRPEVSGELFKQLGPEKVQRVTLVISGLPHILPHVREEVIGDFMASARQAVGASASSHKSALQEAEELGRDVPAIAAKLIAGLWLN